MTSVFECSPKSRDDRFQSMEDVAAALDALDLAGESESGVSTDRIAPLEDTGPVAAAGVTTQTIPPTNGGTFNKRKEQQGGNLPKWLLAGALVFLSAVVIIIKNKDGSETRIDLGDAKSISIKTDRQELEIDLVDGKRIEAGVPQHAAVSGLWKPGPADQVLPGLVVKPKQRAGVRRWQIEMLHSSVATNSLAWHPNGRLVASGTSHGDIRLLDAESLELVRLLPGHHRSVTCVAWSPDGCWHRQAGTELFVCGTRKDFRGLCCKGMRQIFCRLRGAMMGEWLASTGRRGTVRLWTRDGTAGPVLDGHTGAVWCAAFNPATSSVVTEDRMERFGCGVSMAHQGA